MADFRRLLYAFAIVALLVGITVPASAQSVLLTCSGSANNPLIRGEGYTELTGDIFIQCTGGIPTATGTTVPKVDITVFTTTTTITSKLTDTNNSFGQLATTFNEALLIVDEAGSAGAPIANFPMLNCGNSTTQYNVFGGTTPFSCDIGGTGTGATTYCGPAVGSCGTNSAIVSSSTSNCPNPGVLCSAGARPNVFQGRQVSTSGGTAIQFLGVPLDPGPTNGLFQTPRLLRITNLRVDATKLGIYGNTGAFTNSFINTSVTFNGTNFGGQQVISVVNGTVRGGLVVSGTNPVTDSPTSGISGAPGYANFLQCSASAGAGKKSVKLAEGFSTAFKVRNWRQIQDNGVYNGSDWSPNATATSSTGPTFSAADLNQNVPNALYNTEGGISYFASNGSNPSPNNPPFGTTGSTAASPNNTNGVTFFNSTGIQKAGTTSQGTRLYVKFGTYAAGSNPSIPNLVPLRASGITTGYIALVSGADANGAGGTPLSSTAPPTFAALTAPQVGIYCASGCTALSSLTNNTAVYEVIFSNPSALETATVPVFVNPTINLTASPSTPEVGPILSATAGFAPFYPSGVNGVNNARQMDFTASSVANTGDGGFTYSYPVPRFIDNQQSKVDVYDYGKCACDLLFPWVVGDSTFTTSIVIANTSLDPCNGVLLTLPPGTCTAGFTANPNGGKVTFWYYGTTGISLDPTTPISTQASQTTSVAVPAGSYLAHIVSPSAAGTTAANGLTKLSANFAGYVIAQAQFLYCHGVASISANVAGFGTQTYLGLTLDKGSPLLRTVQANNDGLVH